MINRDESYILTKDILSDLKIDPTKLDKIFLYIEMLLIKNETLNLISRKLDIKTIINEHIYDCLSPWEYFFQYDSITDIGTGAGLPGILLSILFNKKKIVLIDKSFHKTMFLKSVVSKLDLKNIEIENNPLAKITIKTEVITCRAFKSIREIIEMTKNYFDNTGKYVLYKGRIEKINEEIFEAEKKYKFKYEIKKTAFNIEKERHIVILYK